MGGWIGGQADYVMVPYADFNLLKFPDKLHRRRRCTIALGCATIACGVTKAAESNPRSS